MCDIVLRKERVDKGGVRNIVCAGGGGQGGSDGRCAISSSVGDDGQRGVRDIVCVGEVVD